MLLMMNTVSYKTRRFFPHGPRHEYTYCMAHYMPKHLLNNRYIYIEFQCVTCT